MEVIEFVVIKVNAFSTRDANAFAAIEVNGIAFRNVSDIAALAISKFGVMKVISCYGSTVKEGNEFAVINFLCLCCYRGP